MKFNNKISRKKINSPLFTLVLRFSGLKFYLKLFCFFFLQSKRFPGAFHIYLPSRLWLIGLVMLSRVLNLTKFTDSQPYHRIPPKRRKRLPKVNKKPRRYSLFRAWEWIWKPNTFREKVFQLNMMPNQLWNVHLSPVNKTFENLHRNFQKIIYFYEKYSK